MDLQIFKKVDMLEKFEKLYKKIQNFNENGSIVSHKYNNHLIKCFIIVFLHLLFMRFMKKILKMRNNTDDAITIIDLSSNIISFISIIKKIY